MISKSVEICGKLKYLHNIGIYQGRKFKDIKKHFKKKIATGVSLLKVVIFSVRKG